MRIKYYLFFICFLSTSISAFAKHIIGGEITYKCLGNGDYEFEMYVYRDCDSAGADFDENAPISIYRCGAGVNCLDLIQGSQGISFTVPLAEDNRIPAPDIECLQAARLPCVEQGIYRFKLSDQGISLPNITDSYYIVYQRCCRNETITNLVNPGDIGSTYYTEITPEAQEACNNSSVFKEFPPTIICANFELEFDHSAIDEDGDSLVYFFTTPILGGGPDLSSAGSILCTGASPTPPCPPPFDNVRYIQGYRAINPLGSPDIRLPPEEARAVTIDSVTGMITGIPSIQGQFVVGVAVAEYRDSVLLNITRRDFQFNVLPCDAEVMAIIASDTMIGDRQFVSTICGETTVEFEHESELKKNIKAVRWEFVLAPGDTLEITNPTATVEFPALGEYNGQLFVNPGSKNCADTANINVRLFPKTEADFSFAYDTCNVGPVTFTDKSFTDATRIERYIWDFGDTNGSGQKNPRHQYDLAGDKTATLTVVDNNNCRKMISKEFGYFPLSPTIVIGPSSVDDCTPARIFFDNLTEPVTEDYDLNWDFGDGNSSTEVTPTHIYEDPGVFTVSLSITSPFDCQSDTIFPALIRVQASPLAEFDFAPEEVTLLNPVVNFRDQSTDATSWFWNFNNIGTSIQRDPTFTFRDTGVHNIQLVVTHPNGCKDTTTQLIDIIPVVRLFMPNAFTPNDDGKNDQFAPIGLSEGAFDFQFAIWNRWGERVFYTTDATAKWNGRKNNAGDILSNGVYVYVVTYTDPRGKEFELKGYATLIR